MVAKMSEEVPSIEALVLVEVRICPKGRLEVLVEVLARTDQIPSSLLVRKVSSRSGVAPSKHPAWSSKRGRSRAVFGFLGSNHRRIRSKVLRQKERTFLTYTLDTSQFRSCTRWLSQVELPAVASAQSSCAPLPETMKVSC